MNSNEGEFVKNRLSRWISVFLVLGAVVVGAASILIAPAIGAPTWSLIAMGAAWVVGVVVFSRSIPLRVGFGRDVISLHYLHGRREIPKAAIAQINYRVEKTHYEAGSPETRGFTVEIRIAGSQTIWATCDGSIATRFMEAFPGAIILSRLGKPISEIPVRNTR